MDEFQIVQPRSKQQKNTKKSEIFDNDVKDFHSDRTKNLNERSRNIQKNAFSDSPINKSYNGYNNRQYVQTRPNYTNDANKYKKTETDGNMQKYTKRQNYNTYKKSEKKTYDDISVHENMLKEIIKNYLIDTYDLNGLSEKFMNILEGKTKKQKASIIEKAISYHLWEVFNSKTIVKELEQISEGDGYCALHWIPWPSYNSTNGKIDGYVRTSDDIKKIILVLAESGCDPLKLSDKREENAFDSLNSAVEYNKNGHVNMKGVYTSGELGVTNEMKNLYLNEFLKIPETNASARLMIREVLNKVTEQNLNEFRTKFCFVFNANPTIVVSELVKIFYQLPSSNHTGTGEWLFVRDFVETYRKIIKLGPEMTNEKQKIVANYVLNEWNSEYQLNNFNMLLATLAIEIAKSIDESKKEKNDSNLNIAADLFCTSSKGAIIGESSIESIQRDFIINSINEGQYDQFIYCLAHTSNKPSKEIGQHILDNLHNFNSCVITQLSNLISLKNQWVIEIVGKCGKNEFKKTLYPNIYSRDVKEYFECLVNDRKFNTSHLLKTIKISFSNIGKIDVVCEKSVDTNNNPYSTNNTSTKVIIPEIIVNVIKSKKHILNINQKEQTYNLQNGKNVDKFVTKKIDDISKDIDKQILGSLQNTHIQSTSTTSVKQNKQCGTIFSLLNEIDTISSEINNVVDECDVDLTESQQINTNDVDIEDEDDDIELTYSSDKFYKLSDLFTLFEGFNMKMTLDENVGKINEIKEELSYISKELDITDNDIFEYVLLSSVIAQKSSIAKHSLLVLETIGNECFLREQLNTSCSNLLKNMKAIMSEYDLPQNDINKMTETINIIKNKI